MPSPLSSLSSRTPFAWLRERDIDLLVCSELHANGELTRLLTQKLAITDAEFRGAWVSYAETDGESDLVVVFSTSEADVVALVENKIAAGFQPEQAERYAARARRWNETSGVSKVSTVLFAPAEYMCRPGAEAFDLQVSYEEVATALRAEEDRRSAFLADALVAGIGAYRQGYVMKPNENVSDMWMACWKTSLTIAPKLRFQQPDLKPGRSTWFYFRTADGFSKEDVKYAVVVYKAERGQVDLQFADTTATSLMQRTTGILNESMKVESAGKSASIRIAVPKIDFSGSASEQDSNIVHGISVCELMRLFFIEHRKRLIDN